MATLDMTDGIYRRIYSGFVSNPKVNSLTWQAEAWFWRLVVLADDYGNHPANWRHLAAVASPVREISGVEAQSLTEQILAAKLAILYEAEGQQYIHICGFTKRQPANKNGRRIQRFPMNPDGVVDGESGGIRVNPGESKKILDDLGGIRVNPVPPIPKPTPIPIPIPTPTPTSTPSGGSPEPTGGDGLTVGTMTMADRSKVRQALIRIGVESGAAQQVSLHPMLTLAMVKSNCASVKKSKGVKSQAAVLLTRLRKELEMIE